LWLEGIQRKLARALYAGVKRHFGQFGVDYDVIGRGSRPPSGMSSSMRVVSQWPLHCTAIVSTGMFYQLPVYFRWELIWRKTPYMR